MRRWRLAVLGVVVLLGYPVAYAPGQRTPRPAAPTGPALRLGALLPLSGPGAWFGTEIRQGLELAAQEVSPAQPTWPDGDEASESPAPSGVGSGRRSSSGRGATSRPSTGKSDSEVAPPGTATRPSTGKSDGEIASPGTATRPSTGKSDSEVASPGTATRPSTGKSDGEIASPGTAKAPARAPREPIEPPDRPRTLTLVVETFDVQPVDLRAATDETNRLLGSGVTAILTASPTPALAAYSLAAPRDILVLHAGVPTDRFPPTSRTLLQLRPSAAARGDVLGAYAWERGHRRLAVVAGGDAFGRALRAAVAARWRQRGGQLTKDESVSLDASDLRARLRPIARAAPEAAVLGFQGAALGEAARALREAGYTGLLLATDDDRAALLAGGSALDGALILSDAFVPVAGSRGARFARAYQARHKTLPSRFAASAYEAATLLAEGASRVLADGRNLTGSRLRDVLAAAQRRPSLYAGDLVIRDDGTVARPLALFRVDGNRLSFESYVSPDGSALKVQPESTSELP